MLGRRAQPIQRTSSTRDLALRTGNSKRKMVRTIGYKEGFTFSVVSITTSEQDKSLLSRDERVWTKGTLSYSIYCDFSYILCSE